MLTSKRTAMLIALPIAFGLTCAVGWSLLRIVSKREVVVIFDASDIGWGLVRDMQREFDRLSLGDRFGLVLSSELDYDFGRPERSRQFAVDVLSRGPAIVVAPNHVIAAAFREQADLLGSDTTIIFGSRRPLDAVGLASASGQLFHTVTGAQLTGSEDDYRRASLVAEWQPDVRRVGLLYDEELSSIEIASLISQTKAALPQGAVVIPQSANDASQFDGILKKWMDQRIDVLVVSNVDLVYESMPRFHSAWAKYGMIPTVGVDPDLCESFATVCYMPAHKDVTKRWGEAIAQVASGMPAAKIAVTQPTQTMIAVNLQNARLSSAPLPQSIVGRAGKFFGFPAAR